MKKIIANDDAEPFYRGRSLWVQMRPHHVRALLKIGKPDFFANESGAAVRATGIRMDAQADLATQIKRIDHTSAVFPMRASVVVYAGWIILCAFSPITNTIANRKLRVIGWPYAAIEEQKRFTLY